MCGGKFEGFNLRAPPVCDAVTSEKHFARSLTALEKNMSGSIKCSKVCMQERSHTRARDLGRHSEVETDDGEGGSVGEIRPQPQQQWMQKQKVAEIVRDGQPSEVVESVKMPIR